MIDRAHSARIRKGDHQMFSLTSPNVTRVQLPNSSLRPSRRTMPLVKVLGSAAIALLAAGNTLANAAENPARMTQEQHACAVVMGLHRPGDLYDTCIEASIRPCLNWIRPAWFPEIKADVLKRGSCPARRLSQSAS